MPFYGKVPRSAVDPTEPFPFEPSEDRGFLPAAYWPLKLVIIESPYAGDVEANTAYARAAMRDSLRRDEAPIASHLLYTQPGILRDDVPGERQLGIDAGLAWREVAELAAFYIDRGWSAGMLAARETYEREGKPFEERSIAIAAATGTAKTPQAVECEASQSGPQGIAQPSPSPIGKDKP
jgi:hypothetical protein